MAARFNSPFAERLKREQQPTNERFAQLVEGRISDAKNGIRYTNGLVFTIELPQGAQGPYGSPYRDGCVDTLVQSLQAWGFRYDYNLESFMQPGTYWFEGTTSRSCSGCSGSGCSGRWCLGGLSKVPVNPKAASSATLIICVSPKVYESA